MSKLIQDILPPPFEWITIPKGGVTLIDNYNDAYFGAKGEKRTFYIETFDIAKYPITNVQFRLFWQQDGYKNRNYWTEAGWQAKEKGWHNIDGEWKPSNTAWTQPRYWDNSKYTVFNRENHPVIGISWYEAMAFCMWLSEQIDEHIILPTEQQWQRAAQGNTDHIYPWGDILGQSRCNYDNNIGTTTPVTEYAGENKGDSPFGVTDMSGNVWEWCLTEYETGSNELNSTNSRVLHGGSWLNGRSVVFRCDYRNWFTSFSWLDGFGFRICSPLIP
jgi:formylglycine-generating enzyme required for sulfatase activity